MPKPSTYSNDIILKVLFMVSEAIHPNIGTLHAANGMLDTETDLTQDCIGSLVLFASLGIGILLTLARLFMGDGNLIAAIIRWYPKITQIDQELEVCKPITLWGQCALQHAVIMMMPTQGAPKKDTAFVR